MYDYTYYGDYGSTSSMFGGLAALGGGVWLIGTAISIFLIVSMWKIFKKAGKQGWESIVPIYNVIVMLEISGLPMWYIVLYIIPFANIYAMFKTYIELAKKFGKGTGFGVLTVFFPYVCFPILGFSNCSYEGVTNSSNGSVSNNNIPNANVMNNVNSVNNANVNVQSVNNMTNDVNQMNSVNTMNNNVEQVNNTMNNVNNDVYSFNSMSDIQTVNQNTEQTVNNVNQTMEQNMNNTQVNTDINGIPSVTPIMPENNGVNTNTDTNNDVNNNQNNNINMFQ